MPKPAALATDALTPTRIPILVVRTIILGGFTMSKFGVLLCGLFFIVSCSALQAGEKGSKKVPTVLKFKMTGIDGQPVDLAKYQGKVVLIVNVASECGYTDQYKGLQALHDKYAKDGLAILGIPCNDFGKQ